MRVSWNHRKYFIHTTFLFLKLFYFSFMIQKKEMKTWDGCCCCSKNLMDLNILVQYYSLSTMEWLQMKSSIHWKILTGLTIIILIIFCWVYILRLSKVSFNVYGICIISDINLIWSEIWNYFIFRLYLSWGKGKIEMVIVVGRTPCWIWSYLYNATAYKLRNNQSWWNIQ